MADRTRYHLWFTSKVPAAQGAPVEWLTTLHGNVARRVKAKLTRAGYDTWITTTTESTNEE